MLEVSKIYGTTTIDLVSLNTISCLNVTVNVQSEKMPLKAIVCRIFCDPPPRIPNLLCEENTVYLFLYSTFSVTGLLDKLTVICLCEQEFLFVRVNKCEQV